MKRIGKTKYIFVMSAVILLVFSMLISCNKSNNPKSEIPEDTDYNYTFSYPVTDVVVGKSYSPEIYAYNGDILVPHIPLGDDYYYEIAEGNGLADLDSVTGDILIHRDVSSGSIVIVSLTNGINEYNLALTIYKVDVTSIEIASIYGEMEFGDTIEFASTVLPASASFKTEITYSIIIGSEYAEITSDTGVLTAKTSVLSPVDISIQATCDGVISNTFVVRLLVMPLTDFSITTPNATSRQVEQGSSITVIAESSPLITDLFINYSLETPIDGVNINSSTGVLEVSQDVVIGEEIIVIATYEEYTDEITIIVISPDYECEILASASELEIGESCTVSVSILPFVPTGATAVYEVLTDNAEHLLIIGNQITISEEAPCDEEFNIQVYYAVEEIEVIGTRSNIITIISRMVEVEAVEIINETEIIYNAGEHITLSSLISPTNATNQTVTYTIESGYSWGYISGGELIFNRNNNDGEIVITASVSGVNSESKTFYVNKYYNDATKTAYSSYDNYTSVFPSNYENHLINLKDLSENAGIYTIIIPNTVKSLKLVGRYSSNSPNVTEDLFFYFYQCTAIEIELVDVGIEIICNSNQNVFDFPEDSNASIIITGDCYISAGGKSDATNNLLAEGVYDSSNDEMGHRINGMDGRNGANGGNAISAYNLEIKGDGDLSIFGGNGANGCNGADGGEVTAYDALDAGGDGGVGGYGGDCGVAILGYAISINNSGSISASAGLAGTGGYGGEGGTASTSRFNGEDGRAGWNGEVKSGIVAFNGLATNGCLVANIYGGVRSDRWSEPPEDSWNVDTYESIIEKMYGINIILEDNPTINSSSNYYSKALKNSTQIRYILLIIDNVLSKYPCNIFREIAIKNTKLTIYPVDGIKRGLFGSYTIAGLATSSYKILIAYSTPKLRNIFYSDVENFIFHELTHIMDYSSAVGAFANNDVAYSVLNTNSSNSIYNPPTYTKNNSNYLTDYSTSTLNEDKCETLSMIARQSRDWDFLDSGTVIRRKIDMLADTMDSSFETCAWYEDYPWEKFA